MLKKKKFNQICQNFTRLNTMSWLDKKMTILFESIAKFGIHINIIINAGIKEKKKLNFLKYHLNDQIVRAIKWYFKQISTTKTMDCHK